MNNPESTSYGINSIIQDNKWLSEFEGEVSFGNILPDYMKTKDGELPMKTLSFEASGNIGKSIVSIVNGSDVGIFMILLSGVSYIQSIYSYHNQTVLGIPVLKSSEKESNKRNILPFGVKLIGESSFENYLKKIKEIVIWVYNNLDIAIRNMMEILSTQVEDDTALQFNTLVALESIHGQKVIKECEGDMKFIFSLQDKQLKLDLMYNADKYKESTINQIVRHLWAFFCIVIENPLIKLKDIDVLSREEKQVLINFNNHEKKCTSERTIIELFEEQVKNKYDRTAVVFKGEKTSYKELSMKACAVAQVLRENGVKRNDVVGIIMESSIEMIIGIMGVLIAGGAYLPISPSYPQDRIKFIIEDSGTKIVLTSKSSAKNIDSMCKSLIIDNNLYFNESKFIEYENTPQDLAYIIYTSGTTGMPKGTMISHFNVVSLVSGLSECIFKDYGENLNVALLASFVFDASCQQIFSSLLLGHTLHIIPDEIKADATNLSRFFIENDIDICDGTPTHLKILLSSELAHCNYLKVRHFIIGGEALPSKLVKQFLKKYSKNYIKITNIYGLSECCVDSTAHLIKSEDLEYYEIIPIGTPLTNQRIYILDRNKKIVPIGAAGELYISGDCVGKGFLNRSDLNETKFIQDILNPKHVMCKTGDIARWDENGSIEFLYRFDSQIKIRGFRIEPGEIENILIGHPSISQAFVIKHIDENDSQGLYAYLMLEKELTSNQIIIYLEKYLPDYMIPSHYFKLDKIPVTTSGKLDMKSLLQCKTQLSSGEELLQPNNKIEGVLVDVLRKLLKVQDISMNDNFFRIGGDSVRAILLIGELLKNNLKIELRDIFKYPRIIEMSKHIVQDDIASNISSHENQQNKVSPNFEGELSKEELDMINDFVGSLEE